MREEQQRQIYVLPCQSLLVIHAYKLKFCLQVFYPWSQRQVDWLVHRRFVRILVHE